MANLRQNHEVPPEERARVIRQFQHALVQTNVVQEGSLTATISPDNLRRTDNVISKGYGPVGGEEPSR